MIPSDIPHVARYLIEKHGLTDKGWKFEWDRARRRAGCCMYSIKTITLSRHYVTLNVADNLDDIINTILHEIAHALTGPDHGHDDVWKAACIAVGAKPERCYDADKVSMPRGRYAAKCKNCDQVFYRHRRAVGHRYHIACGPVLGSLVFTDTSEETAESVPEMTVPQPKRMRGT